MKTKSALAAGLLAAACLPCMGQSPSNWDLTGSGGNGSLGNSLSFEDQGVTVKTTAWGYTKGYSDYALEAAKLGQWSTGIGVTNVHEHNSSPYHQADNSSHNDWVLFVFDEKMTDISVKIDPYGKWDRDVTYWTGNVDSGLNLNGVRYDDLADLGFSDSRTETNSRSRSSLSVSLDSQASGVNAVLFGPKIGTASHDHTDAFKIVSIKATVIPEPSAALLGAIGVLGLCSLRRRAM